MYRLYDYATGQRTYFTGHQIHGDYKVACGGQRSNAATFRTEGDAQKMQELLKIEYGFDVNIERPKKNKPHSGAQK